MLQTENTSRRDAEDEKCAQSPRRIVVLTSCTGKKAARGLAESSFLTWADLAPGATPDPGRYTACLPYKASAGEMYEGKQHTELMRGIDYFRDYLPAWQLDLYVVSAGYGLLAENAPILPYNETFQTMDDPSQIAARAQALRIPAETRRVLAGQYDLALILLGEKYLVACNLICIGALGPAVGTFGGPTLLLCGAGVHTKMQPLANNLRTVRYTAHDRSNRKAMGYDVKGIFAREILEHLADRPYNLAAAQRGAGTIAALLNLLQQPQAIKAVP
jgi:hypothetical protein